MKNIKKLLIESQRNLKNFDQDLYLDPDLILTKEETQEIIKNIESEFINSKDIDWNNIEDLNF